MMSGTILTDQSTVAQILISQSVMVAPTSALPGSEHVGDVILKVIYAIIGVLGLFGNGLVIIVFLKYRSSFNSITNLLILNQSVMDFIVAIVFLLDRFGPTLYLVVKGYTFSEILCRLWDNEYVLWALYIGTTQNLVLISLERYFATVRPILHRNHFTAKRAKIGIVAVWLFGLVYQSYWIAVHVYLPDPESCYPSYPTKTVQVTLGVLVFLLEYLIPLSIMTFSYLMIINMLRNRGQGKTGKVFSRAKKNVTITTILVFLSFVICWSPTEIGYLMFNLGSPYDFEGVFHHTASTLVLVNMCSAPFIYTVNYEQFRNHLKRLICGKVCHSNRVDIATVTGSVQETHDTMAENGKG